MIYINNLDISKMIILDHSCTKCNLHKIQLTGKIIKFGFYKCCVIRNNITFIMIDSVNSILTIYQRNI